MASVPLCRDLEGWGPLSASRVGLTNCFTHSFLLALPAFLFSVSFLFRVSFLQRKVTPHTLGRTGCIYWPVQGSLGLAFLANAALAWDNALPLDFIDVVAVVGYVSVLVATALAMMLNTQEHKYTIRSSDALVLFLLWSTLTSALDLYNTTTTTITFKTRPLWNALALISFVFGLMIESWPKQKTRVQQTSSASSFEKANLISRLTFHYLQSVMTLGYNSPEGLTPQDVQNMIPTEIKSRNSTVKLGVSWLHQVSKIQSTRDLSDSSLSPKLLLKAIFWAFGISGWIKLLSWRLVGSVLLYIQPGLLGQLLDFIARPENSPEEDPRTTTPDPKSTLAYGLVLATAMFTVSVLSFLANGQMGQKAAELGMQVRTGLMGLIYVKSLRLSPEARQKSLAGEISNRMSVDAEKWQTNLNTLPMWFSIPIEIGLALWMLYQRIGYSAIAGLLTVIILTPIQRSVASKFMSIKDSKLTAADSRIQLVTETFSSIKIIKLYGWESIFRQKIQFFRDLEIDSLKRYGVVYSFMTMIFTTTMFMSLISFGIYTTVEGGRITPQVVFVSIALFGLLSKPIGAMENLLSVTSSTILSARRIQTLLCAEELDDSYLVHKEQLFKTASGSGGNGVAVNGGDRDIIDGSVPGSNPEETFEEDVAIRIEQGTFDWKKSREQRQQEQQEEEQQISNLNGEEGEEDDDQDPVIDESSPLLTADSPSLNQDPQPRQNDYYRPALSDINLTFPRGKITVILGKVGSGKSSLLSALTGGLYCHSGSVTMYSTPPSSSSSATNNNTGSCSSSTVAYVSQQAWIMNGSLKSNILFGKPYDEIRYNTILRASGLLPDLKILSAGDETEIGERGINLSGGQKQRVALARAAYQDSKIILLDDPLSAVDAHVDHHLWKELIGPEGILKNKTRIIVTHGIHHLEKVDKIIVLKEGKVEQVGTYKELMKDQGGMFSVLIKEFSATERHLRKKKKSHPQHQHSTSTEDATKIDSLEGIEVGRSTTTTTATTPLIEMEEEVVDEETETSEGSSLAEEASSETLKNDQQQSPAPAVPGGQLISAEKMGQGNASWKMFKLYARSATYRNSFMFLFGYILVECCRVSTNIWLAYASSSSLNNDEKDDGNGGSFNVALFLGVYALLTLAYMLANVFTFYVANVLAATRASQQLHDKLLTRMLRWPMSTFDTTTLGRIVNRQSADLDSVDEVLPWNVIDVVYCLLAVVGSFLVIAVTTPLFLIAVPPLLCCYWWIQDYFIKSSSALKRLNSVAKSPVYSFFQESLSGQNTIRAMKVESRFVLESGEKVDVSAETALVLTTANRWLRTRIEFLGAVIVFLTAVLAVLSKGVLSSSVVGLSLTYALEIQDVTWLVRSWGELSQQLIAVERIHEYSTMQVEAPAVTSVDAMLPRDWPQHGKIEFRNYSTRYREGLDLVVRNLNFTVQGGEKIGIVGRTGAGKSSLALALFRIIEAADSYWAKASGGANPQANPDTYHVDGDADDSNNEHQPLLGSSSYHIPHVGLGIDTLDYSISHTLSGGSIWIDGVDISTVGLDRLRQQGLAIIPQDPTLFGGSIRENLDPFNIHTDNELWEALERAHLKKYVQGLSSEREYGEGDDEDEEEEEEEEQDCGRGLDFKVSSNGENMSLGQRQLLSIARALLKKAKVLVLDEATSAVDVETDELIQRTIRTEFKDRTILTIAHRLRSVLNSDKILVLDQGRVQEYESPEALLRKKDSFFYKLADQAGEIHHEEE